MEIKNLDKQSKIHTSDITPHLTTRGLIPENQETPIHFLPYWITPTEYFFLRNHFEYPDISQDSFQLLVEGEVKKPHVFTFDDMIQMPSKTLVLPLECSGNQRKMFKPKVFGKQWTDGAISQGIWKGVPLSYLLSDVDINDTAIEVVFEAYDKGERKDTGETVNYARSLPIEKALHNDTLIAYELNGNTIPYEHGFPLRLIVPNWYAMASVKWLKKITVIDHHFQGPFQTIDYNYYPNKENDKGKYPVTTMHVNSMILQPLGRTILDTGFHLIEGIAWTGMGNVVEVELSINDKWYEVDLVTDPMQPYSWVYWSYVWNINEKGEYRLLSRAKDSYGHIQPKEAFWNRKGYGYNAIYEIVVKIE
jgi:DMSO/TMAO reductase YedYZ molybdopterin-dependent catalytic subunit